MTSKTEAASQVRQILESVRAQMTKPGSHAVNEAMTRAHFLNPLLGALGYAAIDDILFEHYLPNGKTFLDYRLVVGGKPRVAVEAKALQSTLDDKDAAQVVSYATVLGDEWAVVTNAREWRLYHVFAHAPLEGKLLLTIDLVGWQNDAQFDGVFEQLWLISKDSFEGGDGPASWVASKKLDQLIRAALTDASSSEVKYLRGKLEQKGVAVSAEQIASWLKARLDADTPVAPSPTHVSYPLAADATKAIPTHEGSIPYAVGPPLTPEAHFWLIPAGKQQGYTAAEHLRAWLSKGFWGFGPSTPGRKAIKPGDWACFYAAKSNDILAYGQIAGDLDQPVGAAEWPGPNEPQGVVYKVPVTNLVWLPTPVKVDAPIRATLDAFIGKDPAAGWSWLVQTTHPSPKRTFVA